MTLRCLLLLVALAFSVAACRAERQGPVALTPSPEPSSSASPVVTRSPIQPTATPFPPPALGAVTVVMGKPGSTIAVVLRALVGGDPCRFGAEMDSIPAGTVATVVELYPQCGGGATYRVQAGTVTGYVSDWQTHDFHNPVGTGFPATKGEVRPAGRFLIRRGNEAWMVSLTNPASDVKLWENERWYFQQAVPRADGFAFYWVGFTDDNAPVSTRATTASLFRFDSTGRQLVFSIHGRTEESLLGFAVAPDEKRIAYTDDTGLHVRDLATAKDHLVSVNDATECGRPGGSLARCYSNYAPEWSPDGRVLLANRVLYEPVWTFAFDPDVAGQDGRKLPVIPWPRGWHETWFCTDDGDHYSGPGNLLIYNLVSGDRRPLPRPDRQSFHANDCVPNGTGEVMTVWGALGPSGDTQVRLHAANGSAMTTHTLKAFETRFKRSGGWVADGSGVILSGERPRDLLRPVVGTSHYFLDRAGDLWAVPLVADEVLAILPD